VSKIWLAALAVMSLVFLAGCSSGQASSTASSSPSGSQTQQGQSAGSGTTASGGQTNAPQADSSTSSSSTGRTQQGQSAVGKAVQGQPKNISPQNMRLGKVVSLTGGTVTVAVERGGADTGTDAPYKLTSATQVLKDHSQVSTSGQIPDLGSLGLKSGYYVNLMVNNGNVTSLQFNSNGSQDQGPPPNTYGSQHQGPPPNGTPQGQ